MSSDSNHPVTCQTGDVSFEFIADRPCLDFIASLAERGTTDLEMLRSTGDLERWITESGIVQDQPAVTGEQMERALAVRDAIFGLIQALIDSKPPASGDRPVGQRGRHPAWPDC